MHGMVAIADRAQTIPFTPAPRARGQRGRSGWSENFCGNPSKKRSFKRQSASQQSRLGSCSRDPIGFEGSEWNLYEYVGGRPLVNIDPLGLSSILVCVRCDSSHCWIYANDDGTEHTYGRWAAGYGGCTTSGVQIDVELNSGRGHECERCTEVCDFEPPVDSGYGWYGNNCASYASNVWQGLTNEYLNPVYWYGGHHPNALCQSITNANGGSSTNCQGVSCSEVGGGSSGSSGSSSGSSGSSSSCSKSCSGSSGSSSGGSSGSSGGFF
jgi:hypothetical protein